MEKLRIVYFQKHPGDLASQAGMHILDKWKETLTWEWKTLTYFTGQGYTILTVRDCYEMIPHPASASAPVEERQRAWRRSVAPVLAHAQQAEIPNTITQINFLTI